MKLFLIHCGYYDSALCDGLYEGHVNFFVVAKSFDEAKIQAKLIPEFKTKRMHIDGLQEIAAIDGYRIRLEESPDLQGGSILLSHRHRDLAPKQTAETLSEQA